MEIPAVECCGEICSAAEHSVALVGARDREADAPDLAPAQVVLRQEIDDALDPTLDHGLRAGLGIGGALHQLH